MRNIASATTLILSDDELADMSNSLPTMQQNPPVGQEKYLATGCIWQRYTKKRARTVEPVYQSSAKRHRASQFFAIAARAKTRAATAEAEDASESLQELSSTSRATSKERTRRKAASKKKKGVLPEISEEGDDRDSPAQERNEPRGDEVSENPTAGKLSLRCSWCLKCVCFCSSCSRY